MTQPSSADHIRFGVFEVDLRTREVRKHGIRLKIADQPFQVLRALLEKPAELVTREELQKRIWPDNTFVDFDQSLNRAINKVREALGDQAENPRFIETLSRRGYRFIAPVRASAPAGGPCSAAGTGSSGVAIAKVAVEEIGSMEQLGCCCDRCFGSLGLQVSPAAGRYRYPASHFRRQAQELACGDRRQAVLHRGELRE